MARELRRIPFDEFAANLSRVLERLVRERETIVIEREGTDVVVVKPAASHKIKPLPRRKTRADYEAFRAAAGSWKDVDTDTLVADIRESRRHSLRPPVERGDLEPLAA